MTSGAERWKCKDCGRYELMEQPKATMKPEVIASILGGQIVDEPIQQSMHVTVTGTEARVCAMIAQRQNLGINKYGQTVEDNPLPLRAWLVHQLEELLDAAVYCQRAIDEIDMKADDGR